MKTSELIERLQELVDEHGDAEAMTYQYNDWEGLYEIKPHQVAFVTARKFIGRNDQGKRMHVRYPAVAIGVFPSTIFGGMLDTDDLPPSLTVDDAVVEEEEVYP